MIRLQFINHEEGRVIMEDLDHPEYQYFLKDHLGNVRLTFTTKPAEDIVTATSEISHYVDESAAFPNYDHVTFSSASIYNHTVETGATRSVVVNGAQNKQVGLAKSLRVVPGDTVDMEVYAKYFVPPSGAGIGTFIAEAMTSAFGLSSNSIGPEYSAYQSLSEIFSAGWVPTENDWEDVNAPKAFLNYILFDEEFIPYDMGWDQINIDAHPTAENPDGTFDFLSLQAVVTKPGYIYIYFSNEEQQDIVEVYFDDLTIKHLHGPVVQADDYYPFGLTFNSYRRENSIESR